jgi:hypothetical protein
MIFIRYGQRIGQLIQTSNFTKLDIYVCTPGPPGIVGRPGSSGSDGNDGLNGEPGPPGIEVKGAKGNNGKISCIN